MSKPEDANEPFLSRWARRKRDVAEGRVEEARVDDRAMAVAPNAEAAAADATTKSEEPELDLSTLPKVEELTAESDFTVFLDKRVPAFLRNAALGRMWSLDPTIRDFIEVAENQWNWNVPGGAPFYEEILTAPGEAVQAVAQAGSEAGRALLGSEPETGMASSGPQLKDNTREVEKASATTAPHNKTTTSDDVPAIAAADRNIPNSSGWHAAGDDDAMQQQRTDRDESRKRHGGALPA